MPTFTMRLSDAEYAALGAGAFLANVSMASYAKDAIIDKLIGESDSDAVKKREEQELNKVRAAVATVSSLRSLAGPDTAVAPDAADAGPARRERVAAQPTKGKPRSAGQKVAN